MRSGIVSFAFAVIVLGCLISSSEAWVAQIELEAGWNLISLPLQPPDTDPGVVLSSIDGKYDSVWAYDPDNGWSIFMPGLISDLDRLEPGKGYWIMMDEEGTLMAQGAGPEDTGISLSGGEWNLVGYSSREPGNIEDCMRGVESFINSVWEYAPVTGWSVYIPGGVSDLEVMKPGYGYWIKADQNCVWNVPSPYNPVSNPSFEDFFSITDFKYWVEEHEQSGGTISVEFAEADPDHVYAGNHSCKIDRPFGASGTSKVSQTGITDFEKGATYEASVYVMTESVYVMPEDVPFQGAMMHLRVGRIDPISHSLSYHYYPSDYVTGTNHGTRLKVRYQTDDNDVELGIFLRLQDATGTVWFDDVWLRKNVPSIFDVTTVMDVSSNELEISWETDRPTTAQFEYGLTTEYDQATPLDPNMATDHTMTISNLNPGHVYYYRILSQDDEGRMGVYEASFFLYDLPDHPRLFFTYADIPIIRNRIGDPRLSERYDMCLKLADSQIGTPYPTYVRAYADQIKLHSFLYQIYGQPYGSEAFGRRALDLMQNLVNMDPYKYNLFDFWDEIPDENHQSGPTISEDSENVYSGKYSCKIYRPFEGRSKVAQSGIGDFRKNASYVVSVYVKTQEVVGGEGAMIQVATRRNGYSYYHDPSTLSGTNNWTELTVEFDTTMDDDELIIYLRLQDATGTVWFDDVSLREVDPSNGTNPTIGNSGFEEFGAYDKNDWGDCIEGLSIGYDWCFDLIEENETGLKEAVERRMREGSEWLHTTIGLQGAYMNHGPWHCLPHAYVGLALYDLEIIDRADYYFRDQILPATEEVGEEDGGWNEGLAYDLAVEVPKVAEFCELWRVATGENFFTGEGVIRGLPQVKDGSGFLKNTGKFAIHFTRPDGMFVRTSDTGESSAYLGDVSGLYRVGYHLQLLVSRYEDSAPEEAGYSQWYADNICFGDEELYPTEASEYDFIWAILWQDLDGIAHLPSKPSPSNLPLTQHFPGIGTVMMRSSWNSDDHENPSTIVRFECGDFYNGHHHYDQNSFTIYRKGNLAIDSGYYQYWGESHGINYYQRTVAHNTITVYDPDEEFTFPGYPDPLSNDGGQRVLYGHDARYFGVTQDPKYEMGDIEALDDDQFYTYVRGNATAAYNRPEDGYFKLNDFVRELLFLRPEANDSNVFVVVFDFVSSTNSSFEKKWLLHSIHEPEIDGDTVTILRDDKDVDLYFGDGYERLYDYDGKLIVKTLLPSVVNREATISKVGGEGYEYWVDGDNYPYPYPLPHHPEFEIGAWRIEVTPNIYATEDIFLHVLYPCDVEVASMPDTEVIDAETMVGALIRSAVNRIALFSRNIDAVGHVSYTIYGQGPASNVLCGLLPSIPYTITDENLANGAIETRSVTTTDAGTVRFEMILYGGHRITASCW